MGCTTYLRNGKMGRQQGTEAMDLDDEPKKPANMVIGENLDAISVAELEQRIQALESEIVAPQGRNC